MRDRITWLRTFGLIEVVLVLLSLALCVDVLVAVVLRYGFGTSLGFYDELARYLFVWMSFLGAAIGVKRHGHFGVSFVVNHFPEGIRRVVNVVNTLLMLVFAGFLVSGGWTMVRLTSRQLSPGMEVPVSYLYAPVSISGILMIVYLLPHLVLQLRGRV
jgi:TRAP-type transport system small permease protein